MKDTFQENLLVALKEEVEARAGAPVPPVRSHRRRWALAGGFAAVAVGVGIVAAPMPGEEPAYAVDREPDGSIRVHVTPELDRADVDAIERRLRFFDVRAELDWLDNEQDCAEPRGVYAPNPDVPVTPYDSGLLGSVPPRASDGDGWDWIIHAERIPADQTLVWEIEVARGDDWTVITSDLRLVEGPVAPCTIVPGERLTN